MTDNASILKEFFVKLGVSVDDPGIKKFSDGVDKATKVAGKLATGVEAMAVAVGAAVQEISGRFEDLYYASQRIGSSVEDINAFSFAIGQVGGQALDAKQSLENIAEFLRSNPGAPRWLEGLGVHLKYINGQAQVDNDAMTQLGDRLRAMPYYQAKIIAGMMGIDTATLQALLRGPDEAEKRYHQMAQRMGVDQDKAAKASHEFMNDLRDLLAMVMLVADKVVMAIQPFAQRVIAWLEDLNDSTNGWSTALIALAVVLGPILALVSPLVIAVGALAAGMAALWADFQKWRSGGDSVVDWGAWADQIDRVAAALRPLAQAVSRLGGDLGKIAADAATVFGPAFRDLGNDLLKVLGGSIKLVTDLLTVLADLLEGKVSQAWRDMAKTAKDAFHDVAGAARSIFNFGRDIGAVLSPSYRGPAAAPPATGRSAQARANALAPAQPAAANQNTRGAAVGNAMKAAGDHIAAFFQRNGLTSAQASGITAGAFAESNLNPNAVNPTSGAFGIGQWLGSRKAELFRRYGSRPSLDQQLEFMLWELMGGDRGGAAVRGAGSAAATLDAYVRKFMRPGVGTAGDLSRGAAYLGTSLDRTALGAQPAAVNVNQKTDIHVHGISDPAGAARETASAQRRVNGDLVRNLKSAVS